MPEGSAPDKAEIRAELEATRARFHELLGAINDEDWTRKSGNPDMSVRELVWHLAWAVGWMAQSVDAVKRGKRLWLPRPLVDQLRALAMRWLARNATPAGAAAKYDEGHAALLAKLDAVSDGDWQLRAERFGETRTVEWCFRQPARHFEEHAADVRAVTSNV